MTVRLDDSTVLRHNEIVEYRTVGDGEGGVLLRLDNGAYHGVNEVGALVWRLLDHSTAAELLEALRRELVDLPATFEQEILGFVSDLVQRGLVVLEPVQP